MLPQSSKYYLVKALPLYADRYGRMKKQAFVILRKIESKTKRRPYLRSRYFDGQKVFTNLFIGHIFDKNPTDRKRRLRLLPCAIELIEQSTCSPEKRLNPNKNEKLFRFFGRTKHSERFAVHIKKISNGSRYFISVFPI